MRGIETFLYHFFSHFRFIFHNSNPIIKPLIKTIWGLWHTHRVSHRQKTRTSELCTFFHASPELCAHVLQCNMRFEQRNKHLRKLQIIFKKSNTSDIMSTYITTNIKNWSNGLPPVLLTNPTNQHEHLLAYTINSQPDIGWDKFLRGS